ncbi:MAG: ABC transporter ATP-binding protein [Nitrososphaerales archaeon]
MLEVKDLNVFISESHILRDINLNVKEGEFVTIVGRNGAGKSTLLKTIMGIIKPKSGKIYFLGKDITGYPPHKIANMGVGYSPDDLKIFPSLTVEENIELSILTTKGNKQEIFELVYSIFPKLKRYRKKSGIHISGGERRMLAIARALALNPKLLLLDEPFEGLAPIVIPELVKSIHELVNRGLTLILTEPNIFRIPEFASRVYVIERGEVIYSGEVSEMHKNEKVKGLIGVI